MTKTNSKATKADINATANSTDFLAILANRPEAKERHGNCDFSVACRLITEIAPEVKKAFGDRAFSPQDFYAAICA